MNVTRRRFLKLSVGTIGAAAASEAVGLGLDLRAAEERALAAPVRTGRQVPSVCPYCSVGCGQIVMVEEGVRIAGIEGNPDSPINEGTLCPKGAATLQLVNNEQRWTTVKYRAPGSERWNTDPFFREYVATYTNAATLISADFKDTEELDGVFSGLSADGKAYSPASWAYQRQPAPSAAVTEAKAFADLLLQRVPGRPKIDPTLQDPQCVLQIVKRHFARYTPAMVGRVCGCLQETFLKVAETLLASSGRDKTANITYAVGWTQHTIGVQIIRAAGMLQALLGNIGRPGSGVLALRGHASIQGSTDIATLYHSLPGYLNMPDARKAHDTLRDFILTEAGPLASSYWGNYPKFAVSYFKAQFDDAATKENDFGYDYHPKITADHSHLPMFVAMARGEIKGLLVMGQKPAVGGQNACLQRKALARLDWLLVRDFYETETAASGATPPRSPPGS